MYEATTAKATSAKDFEPSPEGWAKRWAMEFQAARKELSDFQKDGRRVVDTYRAAKTKVHDADGAVPRRVQWRLFTRDIQLLMALMYGQLPKVTATTKWADAKDSLARVGAEMLERILNDDIETDAERGGLAIENALEDRLLPGMGNARVRYEATIETAQVEAKLDEETGEEQAPAYEEEQKTDESAPVDYCHWQDQLWSSDARVFDEVRWWGFKCPTTQDKLVERFGEELGKSVPLNSSEQSRNGDADNKEYDPWQRADVWEVWSKEHRKVFWLVEGFPKILDVKEDPLGLEGFWPFPRPMMANTTTSGLVPKSDYAIVQDLYKEFDHLSTRIVRLEKALKVAGLYDETQKQIQRLLQESTDNDLIPASNWAAFSEKGGIKGCIDLLPIDMLASVLKELRDQRDDVKRNLDELTGISDILRGQAQDTGATATETRVKARAASVRVRRLQDDFARFVTELMRLKAEVISKHFDVETILERSNAAFTWDAAQARQAAELLKSDFWRYRIEVKSESLSMANFDQLKAEKTEYLQGLSTFISAAQPFVQQDPDALPYMLQLLQWSMSGLRGASTAEGILDQWIASVQKKQQMKAMAPPQAAPPDPRIQAQQMKQQADLQKIQAETQADIARMKAETQEDAVRQANQTRANIEEARIRDQMKLEMDQKRAALIPRAVPGGQPR